MVIYCILLNVCFLQRSKGILLGVVGTDVPVKELLKTIPKYKVRPVIPRSLDSSVV